MQEIIERNLQKQINQIKNQIRNCKDEEFEFDSLIYKYNTYNCIKNAFEEEIIEIDDFKELLVEDKNILEKIYNKYLNVNINFAPPTFDDVMLETFLTEIKSNYEIIKQEQKEELKELFKKEYELDSSYKGMIPANATQLRDYSSLVIHDLINEGILQKRDCSGLAYELTDEYIKKLENEKQEREENADEL